MAEAEPPPIAHFPEPTDIRTPEPLLLPEGSNTPPQQLLLPSGVYREPDWEELGGVVEGTAPMNLGC